MASYLMLCMSTVIITLLIGLSVTNVSATCASPQYAEYGHQGIIECNFMAGFTGVFWYLHVKPRYQIVIRMEKQEDGSVVRSGDGYSQGKYDILSNGSLIISNISSYHNQTFKVVHVDDNLHVEELYIELLATVFPDPVFPSINVCSKTNLCLVETIDSGILTCSYNHSKPPVELTWYRLSHEGTEAFHGETITTEDGDWTFSSVSKIDISNHINGPLIAFSCRASSPAISSQFLESVVIMDTTKQPWPSLQENVKEEKYFLINSEARVPCIDVTIPRIFVWKELQRNASEVIGFSANGNIRVVSRKTTRWTISHDGALTLSKVNFEDEGLYRCTLLDGTKYVANVEQVKASVLPQPPTIIVNDCPLEKKQCKILMRDPSSPLSISCYLNGVYPNVTLNMETFGTDLRTISQTTYPAERGNLYNAIITKELLPIGCSTSLNLTCYISKPVSLTLVPEKVILVLSEECKKTESKVAAIVVPIVIITLIICSVIVIRLFHRTHRKNFCGQKDAEDRNMKTSETGEVAETFVDASGEPHLEPNSKREHESNGSKLEKDISQICRNIGNAETEETGKEAEPLLHASGDSHSELEPTKADPSNSFTLLEQCEEVVDTLLVWPVNGMAEVFSDQAVNALKEINDKRLESQNQSQGRESAPLSFIGVLNSYVWWVSSFFYSAQDDQTKKQGGKDQQLTANQLKRTLSTYVQLQKFLLHVITSLALSHDIIKSVPRNLNFIDDNFSINEKQDIQIFLQSLKSEKNDDQDLPQILSRVDKHIGNFLTFLRKLFLDKEDRSVSEKQKYKSRIEARKNILLAMLPSAIVTLLKERKDTVDGINIFNFAVTFYAQSLSQEDVDVATLNESLKNIEESERKIEDNIRGIAKGVFAASIDLDSIGEEVCTAFLGSLEPSVDQHEKQAFQMNDTMIAFMEKMNEIARGMK